jgi:hypothetical protein
MPFLLVALFMVGYQVLRSTMYAKPDRILNAQEAKFTSACPAFQTANLPKGTKLLASGTYDDIEGQTYFSYCVAVYQFTGNQKHFEQAMKRRFKKLGLPDAEFFTTDDGGPVCSVSTSVYFANDKAVPPANPGETEWNKALANASPDLEKAMKQPNVGYAEYAFSDFSEWSTYGFPPDYMDSITKKTEKTPVAGSKKQATHR